MGQSTDSVHPDSVRTLARRGLRRATKQCSGNTEWRTGNRTIRLAGLGGSGRPPVVEEVLQADDVVAEGGGIGQVRGFEGVGRDVVQRD